MLSVFDWIQLAKIKLNFSFPPRTIKVRYWQHPEQFRRDCCIRGGMLDHCSCCCHPGCLALCNRRVMEEMSSRFSMLTVTLMFQLLTVYFCSLESCQFAFTQTYPIVAPLLLFLGCDPFWLIDTELLFHTVTMEFSDFTWLSDHKFWIYFTDLCCLIRDSLKNNLNYELKNDFYLTLWSQQKCLC